jgi:hypothetical protein
MIDQTETGNGAVAIRGTATGDNTIGVHGIGESIGVRGDGKNSNGVYGESEARFVEDESDELPAGVKGVHKNFGPGVLGMSLDGPGVRGKSNGVGVMADSDNSNALIATSRGRDVTAVIVNQWGSGNIIVGRDANNAEVFRVLNNGDVEVRGITLTSDKSAKDNFSSVNPLQILDNLVHMPIQIWNYKTDPSNVRHIGPNAQDFQIAFGLNGYDNTFISTIDVQGVALVAIQGLNEKLKVENAQLRANLENLEARIAAIESKT